MKRWLIAVLLVALILLPPLQANAATTADVTITARGYVCGSPSLTVTWISDTEIRLDWIHGTDAVNTMVRAQIGSVPEDREDGYLVYSGNATTFTDTAVNLDIIGGYVYYKAWSQNALGVWEEIGDAGYSGGVGMTLIAILMLVLGMTLFAYLRTNIVSCGISALVWLFFWGYTRSNPIPGTISGDFTDTIIYYGSILMMVGVFFIYLSRRDREKSVRKSGYNITEEGRIYGNGKDEAEPDSLATYRQTIRSALRTNKRR